MADTNDEHVTAARARIAAIPNVDERLAAAQARITAASNPVVPNELPEEDLVHGQVYEVWARRIIVGAWNATDRKFVGLREKYGERYLFAEIHWNADQSFGTAKAIRELTGVKIPATWFNITENPYVNRGSVPDDPLFILLNALDLEVARFNRKENS